MTVLFGKVTSATVSFPNLTRLFSNDKSATSASITLCLFRLCGEIVGRRRRCIVAMI